MGVVVSEQDVVTLREPTCAEVSRGQSVLGLKHCRISTLWLGSHHAALNGCLASRPEQTHTPTQSQDYNKVRETKKTVPTQRR